MRTTLLALAVAAASPASIAQSDGDSPYSLDPGPRAGTWESTLTGSGQSDSEFDNSNFGVTGSLGYYKTKNLVFTVKQSLQLNDDNDSTLFGGRTIGQAAYQWDHGRWQPYVGMNVGGIYGATVADEAVFGPEVGLKYYVNESTFMFGNISYEVPFDECCKDGVVPYSVGVGFNF
ncbi:MAG: hypothetical protein RLW61_04855 [Gammaproteobacteria bacterium]